MIRGLIPDRNGTERQVELFFPYGLTIIQTEKPEAESLKVFGNGEKQKKRLTIKSQAGIRTQKEKTSDDVFYKW